MLDYFIRSFRNELAPNEVLLRAVEAVGVLDLLIGLPPVSRFGSCGLRQQLSFDQIVPGRNEWVARAAALPRTSGQGRGRLLAELFLKLQNRLRGVGRGRGRGQPQ